MAAYPARVPVRPNQCFSALVDWRCEKMKTFTESEEYRESWKATHCSTSSLLSPVLWPVVPHTKTSLKEHVRNAVHPAVRKALWLTMSGVTDDDSVLFAKAFGEPTDDDDPGQVAALFDWPFDLHCIATFCLKGSYEGGFGRVLTAAAYTHRHMTACPLLPVLVRLLLHFLEEWESFAVLSRLLAKRAWLDQDPRELEASRATFRTLCYSHMKPVMQDLQRLRPASMPEETFLARLTHHWYTWPFYKQPFWIMVRVVDMYMVEGPKVFYRLGLAALKMFAAQTQPAALVGVDVEMAVQDLLCQLSDQHRAQWFHSAFSVPRLPWHSVAKLWWTHLTRVPRNQTDGDSPDGAMPFQRYVRSVEADLSSEIVTSKELWQTLWAWLPEWVISEQPECLFRASKDGYNLRTLYRKCEHVASVILLVKTTKSQVFGAFISSELRERHNSQFFGTGETFLFSLLPEALCYHWSAETDLILRGNDQELAVGSGGGAYGLWLDGELDRGVSSTCLAFKNPPLSGSDTQFSCSAIEVYSCV